MVYKEVLGSLLKNYKQLPRMAGTSLSFLKYGTTAYAFPLRIQVENSTICNLSCQMCPLDNLSRPRGYMNLNEF